jgi:hypothetical protein
MWTDLDLDHGMAIEKQWIRLSYSRRIDGRRLSFHEQYQECFKHLEWGA